MRVREHFLLGTDTATITVTAKGDCARDALFRHAVASILTRYQEEFGEEACRAFMQQLARAPLQPSTWRLQPEDSCWSVAAASNPSLTASNPSSAAAGPASNGRMASDSQDGHRASSGSV
ncbi:MAG: hypothetical protein K6T78_04900 [Alicyclobacillus sp.]|nr:hypothetical protein [Alicyclobacillus sp.]